MKVIYLSITLLLSSFFCLGCGGNKMENGRTLSRVHAGELRSLGMLDSGEKVVQFYPRSGVEVAGSFFTDRRIGRYWIDKQSSSKSSADYAFYPDILSIDTFYYTGALSSPFMQITTLEHHIFRVHVDGDKTEIKAFYEGAMALWQKTRTMNKMQ